MQGVTCEGSALCFVFCAFPSGGSFAIVQLLLRLSYGFMFVGAYSGSNTLES